MVGALLGLLPRVAPGWCPPNGIDGSSARELWLHVMSWLNLGLAGRFFAGRVLGALALLMEYPPRPVTVSARASVTMVARPATPVVAAAASRRPKLGLQPALLAQGQIA